MDLPVTQAVTYEVCPSCGRKGRYTPRDPRFALWHGNGSKRCRYCKKVFSTKAVAKAKEAKPKPKRSEKLTGYELKKPCSNCPFRTDIDPYLRTARAREIVESLASGIFPCHKTVDYEALDDLDEDDVGSRDQSGEKFCAGALIMMHKQGHVGQMARIGARLGGYDPDQLDMDAPVFASSVAFIDAQEGGQNHPDTEDEETNDTCSSCGPGCEWPAGFMTGAGAVRGDSPPEPLECCPSCGEPTCDSCFGESKAEPGKAVCLNCLDWEDDDD